MKYLTAEEILIIHSEIIDHTGGAHGVRDNHLLASSAERARHSFAGQEMFPDIFEKAGAYFHSLAMFHVFIVGNKRTAIAATARFLDINGYELYVTNKELEKFVLGAVTRKLEIDAIARWLKKHTKKI
jgi:death-on-curing protein